LADVVGDESAAILRDGEPGWMAPDLRLVSPCHRRRRLTAARSAPGTAGVASVNVMPA